jgi:hypothetical protein
MIPEKPGRNGKAFNDRWKYFTVPNNPVYPCFRFCPTLLCGSNGKAVYAVMFNAVQGVTDTIFFEAFRRV